MTDVWDEILITAQIGGLTFPVSERQVTGGRAWASRKYPFRNGQDSEDTGQEPRRYEYTVPLYADVDPTHYPQLRIDLIELIEGDEERGIAELLDPEDGPVPVRMLPYSWSTSASRRNGGEMRLVFETVGDDIVFLTQGIYGAQSAAQNSADSLDIALSEAGVTPEQIADVFEADGVKLSESEKLSGLEAGFGVIVESYIEEVGQEQLGPEELVAVVDTLRRRLDAVLALEEANDATTGFPIRVAATLCMEGITDIGQELFRDAPRVVTHIVNGETTLASVAVKLFGDVSRLQELEQLNPGVSPIFVASGSELIVPIA